MGVTPHKPIAVIAARIQSLPDDYGSCIEFDVILQSLRPAITDPLRIGDLSVEFGMVPIEFHTNVMRESYKLKASPIPLPIE